MSDLPPPTGPSPDDGSDEAGTGVQAIEIQEEMEQSFLDYAMSVIVARALPDVRDGLKPVHRRILWSMFDAGVRPDRSHVKCATVVGDVIGKYHPHGDSAVYDALVRMGQWFSLREPLIDPHGNFGSPADPPAAYRYTECRLTPIAMRLMDGLSEDTVDFLPNYDGRHEEPTVLPARFPNLLVNGSQGIAVGMATNIPPHNLGEVIDAVTFLIDHPDATVEQLMTIVKGPDFPTGGTIMGRVGIRDAYTTGRGSIRLRGIAEIVDTPHGEQIVATAMPYQVAAETVEEKAAELVNSRELEGIRAIRNESAKGKTRLVFELKRDAPALVVLNNLYKHTPLQVNFPVNMVALVDGVPRTLSLRDALVHYIEHQRVVIRRRSEFRLNQRRKRAHVLEGRLRALDMIDAIIALIRASEDKAAARTALQAEPYSFSEIQAEDILDMPLHRLTRLGRAEIEEELTKLRGEIAELEAILEDEGKLRAVIKEELAEIREEFASERVTTITTDPGELDIEDLIDDDERIVTISARGYVKATPAEQFRTQGRGGRGVAGARLRDEDYVVHVIHTTAHAYLLFFSNRGRVYRLKAHEIPLRDRSAQGMALVNLLQLSPGETIQAVIDTRDYETHRYLFFATREGTVKKTRFTDYDSSLRAGIIAVLLRDDDELVRVIPTNGDDDIIMVSRDGQSIRFNEDDVRPMGRAAAGVRGMKLRSGDQVVSCDVVRDDADLLIVTAAGFGKRTQVDQFPKQGRGGQGVRGIRTTSSKGEVVTALMVGEDDELLVVNSGGVVIRTSVREISRQGRDATGVRVMNLSGEDVVAAVAPVLAVDDLGSDEANGEGEPPDGEGGSPDGDGTAPSDPGSNGSVL